MIGYIDILANVPFLEYISIIMEDIKCPAAKICVFWIPSVEVNTNIELILSQPTSYQNILGNK